MDDADRPSSEPPLPDATSHEPPPSVETPAASGEAMRPDPALPLGDRPTVPRPHASPEPAPEPARSSMPLALTLIGVVLIVLLLANLYTLYNPPVNEAVPALQREVAGLRQEVQTLSARPTVDLGPLDGRVSALAGDVDHLKADVAKASSVVGAAAADAAAAKAAIAPLDGRITGTDTKVAAADTKIMAQDAKIAGLDKRLAPLEAYVNGPKADAQVTVARQNGSAAETRAAPLAVIAHGILGALSTGRPFEAEVKALAALGVDEARRAPLDAVAAKGAATDADLLAGFGAVRDGIIVAGAPVPVSTGTMFDRLMANAQSIVKVNPTGAMPGEDAQAITTRIEAALKEGQLAAAAAEWDKLPQASKARSADWSARLTARIAAETAARAIETQAVAALAAAQ